jgi:hypothetical protein
MRLGTVLAAISGLVLAATLPAHGGNNKPDFVRVSPEKGHGRTGFDFRHSVRAGNFKAKRFQNHDTRPSFVKRRKDRRRPFRVPAGYYYAPAYAYDYRPGAGSASDYTSRASEAAPTYQPPPVTPKWVHVGDGDGASGFAGAPPAESGLGQNCLSVKTQITVDGNPVDAFGEACLLADGSWELQPAQQTD